MSNAILDFMNLSFTEQEMLEAKQVCLNFNFSITENLAKEIGISRIIFTGMGSSLIFPGKQAKNRAMKLGLQNKVEAYFASDLFQYDDFANTFVFLCSNSGKTKEVILLLDHVKSRGGKCVALTTVADSILAQRCDEKIILNCGFEKGVAATKSVVEQGLVYDSLIFHLAKLQGKDINFEKLKDELNKAAEIIVDNINTQLNETSLKNLTSSAQLFIVGLDNGVAEEITLKCYEIARKMALFYPDTHIVHGVEEAIEGNCAIILDFDQFSNYLSDFEKFSKKTSCKLVYLGDDLLKNTFKNYCLLASGWGLLRNIAHSLQIDIDHPEKASKVGNPFEAIVKPIPGMG